MSITPIPETGVAPIFYLAMRATIIYVKHLKAIIHDFVMLNVVTDTPAARGAIAQANEALRNVFAK